MNSKRICMPKQEPEERIKNFNEINLGYNQNQALNEASRCLGCEEPNCILYCPFNLNIPDFVTNIKNGDFEEAYDLLTDKIYFPCITGRVCPHESLCEKGCTLGLKEGCDPIAIGHLERFIGDWAFDKKITPRYEIEDVGKSVAIVGSGPSGLTLAANLKRKGYQVTIYEALDIAGGTLIYLIPEFRIPKKIIQHEITKLEKLGVRIKYNSPIGIRLSLKELERENNAVFIGIGSEIPRNMGITGEFLSGVHKARDFLFQFNLMGFDKNPKSSIHIEFGDRVVVVGKGDTALDSARIAIRLGATVDLFCKGLINSIQTRKIEIEHTIEEGVKFRQLMNPIKLIGKNGKIREFEYAICKLFKEPYNSGEIISIKTELRGSYSCNHFIIARGRMPNPLFSKNNSKLLFNQEGYIKINPNSLFVESLDNSPIFAGGDIIGNQLDVRKIPIIDAMEYGKLGAKNIDKYLNEISNKVEPAYSYY